jgi:hypothetical protein
LAEVRPVRASAISNIHQTDFATIIVLTDAIDSATLAGVSTDDLQSELCDISTRMLDRS